MSLIPIDEVIVFDITTHDPATGGVIDADSAPTFDVFEETTDTPILDDQTMTKRTSLTGNYRGSITASAANGFEAGKWYSVIVTATVDSITAKDVTKNFRVVPAESSAGVPKVDVSHAAGTAWASGAITAASIASDAITDAKVASDVTIASVTGAVGSVTGAVGSVTGNVGGNVTGSVGSVATGGITSSSFAAGAINAAAIATGAIDADAIADNAIDAGAIAADAITNAKIADGAISAGKLASDTITAAKIAADAITDAKVASDVTIASVTGAVGSVTGAVGSVTGNVGGNVTGSVGSVASGGITDASFAANAITAAKLDPDVTTELQAGLATASALATVAGYIDTEVASILSSVLALVAAGYSQTGTAQAGAAGTITLASGASSSDDFYNNQIVVIASGTGAGQARFISDYTGSSRVAAVATWVTNPDNTSVYYVLPFGAIPGATAPTAAEVRQEMDNNSTRLAAIETDTQDIQGRLPAALVSGHMSSDAVAISGSTTAADNVEANVANLDATVSSRLASAGYTAPPSAATNASAVRTELTTELGRIDATVSSRATPAQVNTEADTALSDVGLTTTITGRIDAAVSTRSSHSAADVWSSGTRTLTNGAGIKKNTALSAFMFLMVDDTDGKTPETGLTITAQRSLDGAAFGSCANSATEVSNGWYKIDLAAGDVNGDTVVLRFTGTGARTREIMIVTEP
jgi:hypothetical protein